MSRQTGESRPKVALFVTCLVDLFRPTIGFASVKLLEQAGCDVFVPEAQTCCGQPAWNSGDRAASQLIARQVIETFERYHYVVAPSGSCAATIRKDYPKMLAEDGDWRLRAEKLAAKTHELISFLTDMRGVESVEAQWQASATYHDSCSGLRSLNVQAQPRALLGSVEGLDLTEMEKPEVCCGFGGAFCVKHPEISTAMVDDKIADIRETGANLLLAGDLGCLMNMAGRMRREGVEISARHVAEVLAGASGTPAIGEPK